MPWKGRSRALCFPPPAATPSPHGTRAPASSRNQRVFLGEAVFCNYFVFNIFTSALKASLPVRAAGTGAGAQHSLSGDTAWREGLFWAHPVGMVCGDLQRVSSGVLRAVTGVERVEKNLDGQRKLLSCGLEAGFGVRSGQSDPWVAVEAQTFQKKTRPLHVVSVTPAARASTSRLCVSCRELSSSTMAPPQPPPPLFQGKKGCVHTKQRGKDWSCVCELRQASHTSHHSLGSLLNCSTKGALKSFHNIGEKPFQTAQLLLP